MFLDMPVDYTTNTASCEDTTVFERFTKQSRNISYYADSIFVFKDVLSSVGYTKIKSKRHTPAPLDLKQAMFRMSSKGILKSLSK